MKPNLIISSTLFITFGLLGCASNQNFGPSGSKVTEPVIYKGIDFGVDGSQWANDYECDDPRFKGVGMTDTDLLDRDAKMDATDCLIAYKVGNLTLR